MYVVAALWETCLRNKAVALQTGRSDKQINTCALFTAEAQRRISSRTRPQHTHTHTTSLAGLATKLCLDSQRCHDDTELCEGDVLSTRKARNFLHRRQITVDRKAEPWMLVALLAACWKRKRPYVGTLFRFRSPNAEAA